MAITSIVSYQVKPGSDQEFIQAMKEAKAIIEPLAVNLRSIRMRRATIAGANTGLYRVSFEYDDLSSWAATLEREDQDAGFNEALKRGQSPDSPATFAGRILAKDLIPVAHSGGGQTHGKVVQATAGHVKPGRMDDYMAALPNVDRFVLRSGALKIRHMIGLVAGEGTGMVVSTSEYADMSAFAEAWKRNDDPEWQAMVKSASSPDSPMVFEFQSILTDVPL